MILNTTYIHAFVFNKRVIIFRVICSKNCKHQYIPKQILKILIFIFFRKKAILNIWVKVADYVGNISIDSKENLKEL